MKIADKRTGEDLYPKLLDRVINDPTCPAAPPLVRKMVEIFGHYTYPSDDHIGEYLAFGYEFTGLKWHYGRECRPVPRQSEQEHGDWLEQYISGAKPLDDGIANKSGELSIPIILGIELDLGSWAAAVNVPNESGYVENLPPDAVVEVPARVDKDGVHPQKIGPLPEALAAYCQRQVSIQKLLVEAYMKRSRNFLLQALLLDPLVDNVRNAERMMDDMLELQKDYLPAFG
jgi:alpha-galactosidase